MTKNSIKTDWTAPAKMDEYLMPAGIIDSNSPVVHEMTEIMIRGAKTPREAARLLFHFIRDDVHYMRIDLCSKASEVIKKRWGNCTNKSVTLVAMLRAANIPARVHYYTIKKEGVLSVISPFMVPLLPDVFELNAHADIFLDGKWINLETEFDPDLYRGCLRLGLIPPLKKDWDGESSMHLLGDYTIDDLGFAISPEERVKAFYGKLGALKVSLLPLWYWLNNRTLSKRRRAGKL
jgi:hypothetical protein